MNTLREQFQLLWAFLRSDFRKPILFSALALLGASIIGLIAGTLSPSAVEAAMDYFMSAIEQAGVVSENGIAVFPLLLNNWRAMLFAILYGLIPFAYLPVVILFFNGFIVGLLGAWYQGSGLGLLLYAAGLLPHGIFELPALIISAACGVCLCRNVCRMILHHPQRRDMVSLAADLLRVLLLVIAPLTVAAAFMECYVTPLIMAFFM